MVCIRLWLEWTDEMNDWERAEELARVWEISRRVEDFSKCVGAAETFTEMYGNGKTTPKALGLLTPL